MNLVDRAAKIRADLKQLDQVRELAAKAAYFSKRADELQAAAAALTPIGMSYRLTSGLIDLAPLRSEVPIKWWNSRFRALGERYLEDPNSVLEPAPGEDARQAFLNPLKQLPQKLGALLQLQWSVWAQQQVPKINEEVLGVLAGVPSMAPKIASLRANRNRAAELAATLPSANSDLGDLKDAIDEVRRGWQEMAGEGVPLDVIDFLRIAGQSTGAALEQLTPSVLSWMRAHNLQDTLRIRIT